MPQEEQGRGITNKMQTIDRVFQGAMHGEAPPPPAVPKSDDFDLARKRAVVAGVASLALLLVIRPPFVMCVRADERRPWRVSSAVSWPAVFLAVMVMSAAAVVLPSDVLS